MLGHVALALVLCLTAAAGRSGHVFVSQGLYLATPRCSRNANAQHFVNTGCFRSTVAVSCCKNAPPPSQRQFLRDARCAVFLHRQVLLF
jgi:hypothetical protein